jgi:hypothetical protein
MVVATMLQLLLAIAEDGDDCTSVLKIVSHNNIAGASVYYYYYYYYHHFLCTPWLSLLLLFPIPFLLHDTCSAPIDTQFTSRRRRRRRRGAKAGKATGQNHTF